MPELILHHYPQSPFSEKEADRTGRAPVDQRHEQFSFGTNSGKSIYGTV